MPKQPELPVEIVRNAPPPASFPFTRFFKGFEGVQAVRAIFGDDTEKVLDNLKVGFISLRFMYMGIRDEDGSISIGTYHLAHSPMMTLYLDIVHELFHIKQWQEDKEYFGREHRKFIGDWSLYFASPIEVPAYRHTVIEAERLGMKRSEIVEHLKMGPTPLKVFAKFLRAMELGPGPKSTRKVRLPVRIDRKAPVVLYPFTDYFKGFEKVAAVRALFGEETEGTLSRLRVEFIRGSFIQMLPSDEDGHLVVGVPYLTEGDTNSIYLDVLLCLNMFKRTHSGGRARSPSQGGFWASPALTQSFKAMAKEARLIGVPDERILEHTEGMQFRMGSSGYEKFLRELGLGSPAKRITR